MRLIHLVCFFVAAAAAPAPPALAVPPGAPPASGRGVVAVAPVVPGVPRIAFAGRPLPITDPALTPFRDPSDNALCAAPESLAPLGVTFTVGGKAETVTLTSQEGKSTTVRARKAANGRIFVPVLEVMEALGGKCEWQPSTNTVYIRAVLTSVEMLGGQLRIKSTLPVTATVINRRNPAQVIVDVPGAEIGKLPRRLPLMEAGITAARTGQFLPDTARIVLDLKEPAGLAPPGPQPSTLLILNPLTAATRPVAPIVVKIPPDPAPTIQPAPAAPPAPPKLLPIVVSAVTFRRVNENQAQIVISAARAPQIRPALFPGELTLDLPNVTLGTDAASTLDDIKHPLVNAVKVVTPGPNAARVHVELNRVVAYSVSPSTSPAGVVIDMSLPLGAGGKLAGKLVVVDAGHGGTDPGAYGVGGYREKNVNLAVSRALRDKLREAGANVIMTRSDDVFIGLSERPRIGNRAGADLFVSVHSDSAGRNSSVRGFTVYHHKQVPSCRALAYAIAERMTRMGGIPPSRQKVRSDAIRFPTSGFAVLRGSRMAAVLVECGYMTNSHDVAHLVNPATQRRIAAAIVDGLRDYVEGAPRENGWSSNERSRVEEMTLPFQVVPATSVPGGAGNAPSVSPAVGTSLH